MSFYSTTLLAAALLAVLRRCSAHCEPGSVSVEGCATNGRGLLQHKLEERIQITVMEDENDGAATKVAAVSVGAGGQRVTVPLTVHPDSEAKRTGFGTWMITVPTNCTNSFLDSLAKNMPIGSERRFEGDPDDGGLCVFMMNGTLQQVKEELETHEFPAKPIVESDSDINAIPDNLDDGIADAKNSELLETASEPLWGLDRIDDRYQSDGNYNPKFDGRGVHAFVFDTGIRVTHTDFGGRAFSTLECLGSRTECSDATCAVDSDGHGTHCAGTIGGQQYGVAKAVKLHAVKVIRDDGKGSTSYLIDALDWVMTKGKEKGLTPSVVSASLGGKGNSGSVKYAVDKSVNNGVTVVVAAGNEGNRADPNACSYQPAYVSSAVTVGATDISNKRASFSNYGSCVDIFAPGKGIKSAHHSSDDDWTSLSGTSMATPHVAGVAALFLNENPALKASEVADRLVARSTLDVISGLEGNTANRLLYMGDGPDSTPMPTPAPPQSGEWHVTLGACTSDGTGNCVMSPNYPNSYANGQTCRISVGPSFGPVSAEDFNTEKKYDKLKLNGKIYHGTTKPNAVALTTDILWESDHTSTKKGWKLCKGTEPMPAPTPNPASNPVPNPTPRPTPSPTFPNPECSGRGCNPTPGPNPTPLPDCWASNGGDYPICIDGIQAKSWDCYSEGRGNRVSCPKSFPIMCAAATCGTSGQNYCCEKNEDDCSQKGGLRQCTLQPTPQPTPKPTPKPTPQPTLRPTPLPNLGSVSCPWQSSHSGRLPLCEDGEQSWSCVADNHGQRKKCPNHLPKMCVSKENCGGGQDYCCEPECSKKGGQRPCE